MAAHKLVYTPRAQDDLLRLETRFSLQVARDLTLLEAPLWPLSKVKRLRGPGLWELKAGDYRVVFLVRGVDVVIARVVNRRDLHRAIAGIDAKSIAQWAEASPEGEGPVRFSETGKPYRARGRRRLAFPGRPCEKMRRSTQRKSRRVR